MRKVFQVIAVGAIVMALTGCQSIYDDGEGNQLSREMEFRSLGIVTDKETGCQYISAVDAGITPRLNADGTQFGCK